MDRDCDRGRDAVIFGLDEEVILKVLFHKRRKMRGWY